MYFRKKSICGFSKRTSKSICVNRKIPQVQPWCCAQQKRPLTQFSPKPISIKAMWFECKNVSQIHSQHPGCHLPSFHYKFSTLQGDLLSSIIPYLLILPYLSWLLLWSPVVPLHCPIICFWTEPTWQSWLPNPGKLLLRLKTTQHNKHTKTHSTSTVNRKGLV